LLYAENNGWYFMGVSEWVWRVYLVTNGTVANVQNAAKNVTNNTVGIHAKESVQSAVNRVKKNMIGIYVKGIVKNAINHATNSMKYVTADAPSAELNSTI